MGDDEYIHPSYGSIVLSKMECSPTSLYGSSIDHTNVISLKIKESATYRKHHEDQFTGSGGKTITEVYLSPLQFSEMLTTMNQVEGIPCTINRRIDHNNGKLINFPQESFVNKVEEFLGESTEVVDDLRDRLRPHLNKVANSLELSKPLGKTAQKELLSTLKDLDRVLSSNSKFMLDQVSRFMDKTVVEAKATIDSHVDTIVRNTGLEVLHKNLLGDNSKQY